LKLAHYNKNLIICGCDEAGRGALAGPVFASAVILPKKFYHPLLNDSKKISKKTRNLLRVFIEKNAIAWAVAKVSHNKIDKINILNASIEAMHKAITKINHKIDLLIIDGNRFKEFKKIKHKCIIKGDSKYISIASASILAKTHRDDYMDKIHETENSFNWRKNKGYPTKEHKLKIKKFGFSKYHRVTFKSN
tara:strand:+ start:86 stop:661 length:576 start_codon:yes stop_codon:yes gene_type:complete